MDTWFSLALKTSTMSSIEPSLTSSSFPINPFLNEKTRYCPMTKRRS